MKEAGELSTARADGENEGREKASNKVLSKASLIQPAQ